MILINIIDKIYLYNDNSNRNLFKTMIVFNKCFQIPFQKIILCKIKLQIRMACSYLLCKYWVKSNKVNPSIEHTRIQSSYLFNVNSSFSFFNSNYISFHFLKEIKLYLKMLKRNILPL